MVLCSGNTGNVIGGNSSNDSAAADDDVDDDDVGDVNDDANNDA